MNDIQFMKVFNASYNLMEKPACFRLFNPLILHYVVKQFSPTRVFHY